MKSKKTALAGILLFATLSPLFCQDTYNDFFRSTGKINTVLAVVLILFFVLILFLVRLNYKINKLEKNLDDEKQTG